MSNGTDEATPVKATKKSKKVVEEPVEDTPVADASDEHPFSEDDDNDNENAADDEAQALAKQLDSGDEDEAEVDSAVAFKKGQDVGKIPKPNRRSRGTAESREEPGVVYIGRKLIFQPLLPIVVLPC